MLKLIRLPIFLLLFLLIASACSDGPTSVGYNLIPNSDQVSIKDFDTQTAKVFQKTSYFNYKALYNTPNVLIVGKNSELESQVLMKFGSVLPDTLYARVQDNQLIIKEVWLNLSPKYSLGDKNEKPSFNIFPILKSWTSEKYNLDSLNLLSTSGGISNADIASNIRFKGDTVLVNLDKTVVLNWLKEETGATIAQKNYGIILKPDSKVINRFFGFNASNSSYPDLLTTLNISVERGTFKDTLTINPQMSTSVVKATKTIADDNKTFYVQGGSYIKSKLFFDLSMLPKNIILNKAVLEITANDSKSFDGVPKSDSIFVQQSLDSVKNSLTSDSLYSIILSRKNNIYSGDISWIAQKWMKGESNQGMQLFLSDMYNSVARIAFYGSKETNELLRPRLKLIYTLKK